MTEQELEEALMGLVQMGMVDVTYDENLEALFQITPKGEQAVKDFYEAMN